MQRITITIEDDLADEIDQFMGKHGYQSRSEAIRDLARSGLNQADKNASTAGTCVAALVYVYDHHVRELSKRLTQSHHHHHDLSMATLHVHLDHDTCLEIAALKGRTQDVQHLADHIITERGVKHGQLVIIPADITDTSHAHGEERAHRHTHVRIRQGG
ncbi:MAG TPA: nickel-responsive transcriptional regulator NikR [Hyphomicrobiaceae bacterium]|nr:nickel-responsive transcriptional regulator NikR [Hyphomicrobiaceae bacterium]